MVMTFVLHPLFHYNSITKSRACLLLSLLEDLSIDFSSHFILSLTDVYRDMMTRYKLIFPLAITRILHHFSVFIPDSHLFTVMGAINTASVQRSEAQPRLKQPRIETTDFPTPSIPSTSAPSSLSGGVTLKVIMA